MIKHYCDRCGKEIMFNTNWFNPYTGRAFPNVKLRKNDFVNGDSIIVAVDLDLCETCFDNVLAYAKECKI